MRPLIAAAIGTTIAAAGLVATPAQAYDVRVPMFYDSDAAYPYVADFNALKTYERPGRRGAVVGVYVGQRKLKRSEYRLTWDYFVSRSFSTYTYLRLRKNPGTQRLSVIRKVGQRGQWKCSLYYKEVCRWQGSGSWLENDSYRARKAIPTQR